MTDGRVLVSNSRRALIQVCDDALICNLQWLDRETWAPLDLVVPEDQEALYFMIPDTDWIFSPVFGNGRPASGWLLNVTTGELIAVEHNAAAFLGASPVPAVSPDGRLLATKGDNSTLLQFRDLASGGTVHIELDEAIAGPMFFVNDSTVD